MLGIVSGYLPEDVYAGQNDLLCVMGIESDMDRYIPNWLRRNVSEDLPTNASTIILTSLLISYPPRYVMVCVLTSQIGRAHV